MFLCCALAAASPLSLSLLLRSPAKGITWMHNKKITIQLGIWLRLKWNDQEPFAIRHSQFVRVKDHHVHHLSVARHEQLNFSKQIEMFQMIMFLGHTQRRFESANRNKLSCILFGHCSAAFSKGNNLIIATVMPFCTVHQTHSVCCCVLSGSEQRVFYTHTRITDGKLIK